VVSLVNLVLSILVGGLGPAVPLALASVGEIATERSGIVNIGIEGMMLISGLVAAVATYYTGSPLLGLLCGGFMGFLLGLLFGYVSAYLKANQIVAGIGVNLLAVGVAVAVLQAIWGGPGQSSSLPTLSSICVAGVCFSPYGLLLLICIPVLAYYVLERTALGLIVKSCGEDPRAAEAMGVPVELVQCLVTGCAGFLHGLAGSYLVLGYIGRFTRTITAGRGFIALAIVVISNWNPVAALIASYLFGVAEVTSLTLQVVVGAPGVAELFNTLPYVAAIVAVAVYGVRAKAPAWLGRIFVRE